MVFYTILSLLILIQLGGESGIGLICGRGSWDWHVWPGF